ncbi:hypothetical protein ACIA5G_20075 [Amycolatopsis sp. NPDC051758]|uniref:hypothetical protein n=1 Tax=Amycolatopsis sp. NPDC051758 TaxID=3363935 RepID=UPI00379B1669
MNETLSLLAALVSAVAAVIGTGVSVAQWRASRPQPPVAPPASRPPASPRWPAPPQSPAPPRSPSPAVAQPPGRGLARTAAVAVASAAVTAVFSALSDFVFWSQQQSSDPDSGLETLLSVITGVVLLAALAAILLGLFVLAAGLVTRRNRLVRLGLLAVLLSQTLWPAIWLTTLM